MKPILSLVIFAVIFAVAARSQQTMPAPEPVNNQTQAQKADFVLKVGKSDYCVGEVPQYVIVGPASMAGMAVTWSSSVIKNGYMPPMPVAMEQNVSYGHRLGNRDGASYWSGTGSVFAATHAGSWSKTAIIGGQAATIHFNVGFCQAYAYGPRRTYLTPESGSILFNRLPGNSVEHINVVFEGGLNLDEVAAWRVIVNNQNATEAVNNLPGFVQSELFEDQFAWQMMTQIFLSATVVHIPYPVKYLRPGMNKFEVTVLLQDNRRLYASANYIVRTAKESVMKPPRALPEEMLECGVRIVPAQVSTNQYVDFWAQGGDGTYGWDAPGARYPNGEGQYHSAIYDGPGAKMVAVRSGSQLCTVNLSVVQGPPPPPIPPMPPLPAVPGMTVPQP